MENITKTVNFTFTKQQFEYFAQKKGWTKTVQEEQTETVTNEDGSTSEVTNMVDVPNPILAEDFIVPILMKDFVAMISTPWVLEIAEGFEAEKQLAIKQAQETLAQGINVTAE